MAEAMAGDIISEDQMLPGRRDSIALWFDPHSIDYEQSKVYNMQNQWGRNNDNDNLFAYYI